MHSEGDGLDRRVVIAGGAVVGDGDVVDERQRLAIGQEVKVVVGQAE